jgi:hypothetical protein
LSVIRKQSKPKRTVSAKQRESDDALREELRRADPEKFKRLISPLFRSLRTEEGSSSPHTT